MKKYFEILKKIILRSYNYFFIGLFLFYAIYLLFFIYTNLFSFQNTNTPTTASNYKILNISKYQEIVTKKDNKQDPLRPNNITNPFFR